MNDEEPQPQDPRSPFGRVMAFVLMLLMSVVGYTQSGSPVVKGFFVLLALVAVFTMVVVVRANRAS